MGTRGNFSMVLPVRFRGAVTFLARCQGRPQTSLLWALESRINLYHRERKGREEPQESERTFEETKYEEQERFITQNNEKEYLHSTKRDRILEEKRNSTQRS